MIEVINPWDEATPETQERVMRRSQADLESVRNDVADIMDDVRKNGDEAIVRYANEFDDPNFDISKLRVTEQDIEEAYRKTSQDVIDTMKRQIMISRTYAESELANITMDWNIETTPGVVTGSRLAPIESVGLYVPAGKAPLPVVAQILCVPASVAGVPRKVVCAPPSESFDSIIVSAHLAGADEIYRVGGVPAITALTYGTETIKPVNFIAGPGNLYVQAAKLSVFGKVGIDMLSGPSEALIIADERANPVYLAADILARCEHGSDSAGVVVTNSAEIAEATLEEVKRQAPKLERQQYIQDALTRFSAIIVVKSLDEAIDFANEYSAEHLEVQVANAREYLPRLRNAGSIFLGDYAPVAVGDYASGTNHCLPTGVAPKFASPVGVRMFLKASGYQELTQDGLGELKPIVETLSDVEGLDAHKRSVQIRFESEK